MCSNKTNPHNTENITFPLTLQEAVHLLAHQRLEKTNEINGKQLYNKTWQQLTTRLNLLFEKFPKKLFRIELAHDLNYENLKMIDRHMGCKLSEKNIDEFYKKIQYIYCATTMYYIQHKDSPLAPNEVPSEWIKNKKKKCNVPDLKKFFEIVDEMRDDSLTVSNSLSGEKDYPIEKIIKLIDDSEKLVATTYDHMRKECISLANMRQLLSAADGYAIQNKYAHFCDNLYRSPIEEKLKEYFPEYEDFCEDITELLNIFENMSELIWLLRLGLKPTPTKISSIKALWDEESKTKTEISPSEFEFFSCLLDVIPIRKKGENGNITNQLTYGKWEVLPTESRDKIYKCILKMCKQPQRLARFLGVDESDDEESTEKIKAEIILVCLKTLYPHQYKAYQEIVTLAPIVSGDCAPLLFDNLPKTLKTISLINKELRLAYNETVQNE